MLFDPLFAHARSKPQEIAVMDDTGTYTWHQLAGMSAGLGAYLARQTQKDKIGLLLPTGAGFFVSFFGTLLAGKSVVPINFLLGEREITHIITDSGIDTVLTFPLFVEKLSALGLKVIDLTTLPRNPPAQVQPSFPSHGPNDLAVLMYTSGTSGTPKGVMLTYNNLEKDVQACIEHVQLTGKHRFLGLVPLFHSTGLLATLLAPVYLGSAVDYIGRFSAVAALKAIKEQHCTVIVAVPSMYGALLRLKDAGAEDFKDVYACISGGEPLPEAIREAFEKRFGSPLLEGYGLTETIGPICVNTPQHQRAGSVGRLIPGAEVRITDPDTNVALPAGQAGEIWIKGPMVMKGYFHMPDETQRALTPDGFFKSGDLGLIDTDGYLHVTGRLKDLIIVAGEKVTPREVEDAILKHPGVEDVAVLGRKDASRGEAVVAFVVLKEGESLTDSQLREFLRKQGMMNWKIPRDVIVATELPRSPTGKVLKRVLLDRLAGEGPA